MSIVDIFEDIGDWFSGLFENVDGLSSYGIIFALIALGVSYGTRFISFGDTDGGLIEIMTASMPHAQRLFWTIASYAAAGIAGYFMGKKFEDTA